MATDFSEGEMPRGPGLAEASTLQSTLSYHAAEVG